MRAHRHGEERGQAVVELAFAVPVLLATMLLGMWGVLLARESVVLAWQARDVSRALARGEQVMPPDPSIRVQQSVDATTVTVRLTREVDTPVLGGLTVTLSQSATTLRESS